MAIPASADAQLYLDLFRLASLPWGLVCGGILLCKRHHRREGALLTAASLPILLTVCMA